MTLDVYTNPRWDLGGGDSFIDGMKVKTRFYDLPEAWEPEDSGFEPGDFLPTDSDYLIVSCTAQKDRKAGANVVRVEARKPDTYSGANPFGGGLVELVRSRGPTKEGEEKWSAFRQYICPNSLVAQMESGLWDQRYPGIGGAFSPRARRIAPEMNWLPGYARLTQYFRTVREVGKAVLVTRQRERKSGNLTVVTDKNGVQHRITGSSEDSRSYFEIISGDNALYEPFQEIIFQTAYRMPGFELQTFFSLYRHVNRGTLVNFGNAAPGTMLFLGVSNPGYEWGEDIIDANLHFMWSGNETTWNEMLKVQEGIWIVNKVLKYEWKTATKKYATLDDPEYARELKFLPGRGPKSATSNELVATKPETIAMFKEADFSSLDNMIVLP